MTDIVIVPAAPVVPPFPALGSPDFNQAAYNFGVAMPGVSDGVHDLAVTAHTNATAAQEQATAAAGSATAAAASESNASTSATNAAQSASDAIDLVEGYLGVQATDPATGRGGVPLINGNWYINSASGFIRAYTAAGGWVAGVTAISGVSSLDGQAGPLTLKTINGLALLGAGNIEAGASIYRVARTSNTALAAVDKGKLIDITSGTFTQTFAATATLGDGWFCYLRNSGAGVVTLDPNAAETIDGVAAKVIDSQQTFIVQCDGSALRTIPISGVGNHAVVVHTGNGRGSTYVYGRRYTTTMINIGTAITYADSVTNAASFAINEAGLYEIQSRDVGQLLHGASLNTAPTALPIDQVPIANRLGYVQESATLTQSSVSMMVRLAAGDVVRPHNDSNPTNTTDKVFFSIRKVGL